MEEKNKDPVFKDIPCRECGKIFTPKTRASKFCSPECRKTFRKKYKHGWYEDNKERINREKKEERKRQAILHRQRLSQRIDRFAQDCEIHGLYKQKD